MEVNPSVPAKTVPEFIAYAKANPGKINMASAGNGTALHVAGELFKMMTGVDMVHVPYRGDGPPLTDLHRRPGAGRYSTPCRRRSSTSGPASCARLAVTTATRSDALPDVPTVGEFVPGYEASALVRHRRAEEHARRDHRQAQQRDQCRLADPELKARLADLGGTALHGSPADFGKLIAEETEKWAKVVKFSAARPE